MSRTFRDSMTSDLDAFYSVNEFAQSFTLSRGVRETESIAAITAIRTYERVDSAGNVVQVESVDFDMPSQSYEIDGEQVDPAPGDRFGDGVNVWEAMAIGRRKCFEAIDGDALTIRVHAKKVVSNG